jgi:hypothetical protein
VGVLWERYPMVAGNHRAREWLQIQADLGLARNTVEAYGRSLEDYLRFSAGRRTDVVDASRTHIAAYVCSLSHPENLRDSVQPGAEQSRPLANATIQLRLTTVRLFYDYLVEEGLRLHSPVGRGRYTPGNGFGGHRARGLVPRFRKIPWIPSDAQWAQVLSVVTDQGSRDLLMFALAYDGALRRERAAQFADRGCRSVGTHAHDSTRCRQGSDSRADGLLLGANQRLIRRVPARPQSSESRTRATVPVTFAAQPRSTVDDLDLDRCGGPSG